MTQLFYFSPTGGTKAIGTRFCAGISSETRPVNLATWSNQEHKTKVATLLEQRVYYKINVPGNRPYKQSMRMPATPISLPDCRLCGACAAACPTKAIAVQDNRVSTNGEQCMLCMACTSVCPEHLRTLPLPLVEKLNQMLAAAKTVRRENEVYL